MTQTKADKPKILIVEDEAIIALDIEFCVKSLGYVVCGLCSDYSSAVDHIKKHKPDLVLLDINLNHSKSGIELANYLRLNHNIPYVFITAFNDEKTFNEALGSSPYGYITKPYQKEHLRNAISISLNKFAHSQDIDFESVLTILNQMKESAVVVNAANQVVGLNHCFQDQTGYLIDDIRHSDFTGLFQAEANTNLGKLTKRNKDLLKVTYERFSLNEDREEFFLYQFKNMPDLSAGKSPLTTEPETIADQYLFIKYNSDLHKVLFDDILWLEAMDNYVKIITAQKTFIASYYISEIEKKLPARFFIRTHRSYIVSFNKIERIIETGVVINEKTIPVSRGYRPLLLARINAI